MSLLLHHQRKLKQHLENAKKARKWAQAKTGESLTTQVVLKQLQDEAKERAAKKKNQSKEGQKVTNVRSRKRHREPQK